MRNKYAIHRQYGVVRSTRYGIFLESGFFEVFTLYDSRRSFLAQMPEVISTWAFFFFVDLDPDTTHVLFLNTDRIVDIDFDGFKYEF